jgi:hypothetical protein
VVFKILDDQTATGAVERFKARVVARGDSHQFGVEYGETYAPVARFASFRILVALAAHHDLDLEHVDITTVYLYDNIDTEIYMRLPPGCKVRGLEHKVCKLLLHKSIYGFKQAGYLEQSISRLFNKIRIYAMYI